MRAGRAKAETNLQRFNNQAKEFIKSGQEGKAKRVLSKKKGKVDKIKKFDTQFNIILDKLKEVKNSTQMMQVLNATKYCNNLLLIELSEKETGEPTDGIKEYQDLLENDKEITKYSSPEPSSGSSSLKPLNTLKSSTSPESLCPLQTGCVIEHQRFGIGTVVKVEGTGENTKATVDFRHVGTKQLLLKFARYTVVKS